MGRFSNFLRISTLILAAGQFALTQQASNQPGTNSAPQVNGSQTPLPAPLPLATPPAIALPGSGTPIGGPVQVGVNDPRNGSGYVEQQGVAAPESYVISPQMVAVPGPGNNVAPNASPNTEGNAVVSQGSGNPRSPRQTGMANFSAENSKIATRSNSGTTLADIASQLKARKANVHSRQFTNQDIYAAKGRVSGFGGVDANSEGLPQSDVVGRTNEGISSGVLDQRDLDAVNAALTRSQAKRAAKEKADLEKLQQGNGTEANPKF